MKPEIKNLVSRLGECIHACNACMEGSLGEKHVAMMIDCIRIDRECSAICSATLGLVYDGGHFVREMLELCIRACERCAVECTQHDEGHCRECARACHDCAKACRDYLAAV